MGSYEVLRVPPSILRAVIGNYAPRDLFLSREGRRWVAVDNSTGHAWTEEFRWKHRALRWLRGSGEAS